MNLLYNLMLLTHILLLVFWLGTDVGVFVSALWIKKLGRPMGERFVLLQLAFLLDVMPRLCATLMFPLGATLARDRWGLEINLILLWALWVIAFVWCGAILTAYRRHDTPIAALIGKVQTAGFAAAGIGAVAWGLWLFSSNAAPVWLALKITLFGLIYFLSIGIEVTFRPAVQVLVEMSAHGGSSVQEARLRSAINLCCAVVLMLWVAVVAASALGTFKLPA